MAGIEKADSIATSGFFVLRTPFLPFDELVSWSEGLQAPSALEADGDLEAALTADRTLLRGRLSALLARPEILEALYVASPDLMEGMPGWADRPESEKGRRFERSLVRYLSRMSGRATPFGLFAGCSVGTTGPETALTLEGRASCRRHTRLDTYYLSALVEALGRDKDLRKALTFRPNSSLYHAGGRLRYAEGRMAGGLRSYHLVAVESTSYLDLVLSLASGGARRAQISAALVEADEEIAAEDAEAFVDDLIDCQILVPELPLGVTGPEPISGVLAALGQHPETSAVLLGLTRTRESLVKLDEAGPGASINLYSDIAKTLEALPAKVERQRLFQVDLAKASPRATLGPEPLEEILRGVEILRSQVPRHWDPFEKFREAFAARYEGREVPLVEVLDEEIGIGFQRSGEPSADTSPLVARLPFPRDVPPRAELHPQHRFLMQKLETAIRDGAVEMTLTDAEVSRLAASDGLPLPDAFSVTATLAAASTEELAAGRFSVLLGGAAGPSGARFLGRFCHGDAALRDHVERHLRAEEALTPGAVFAEVVHLPQGRLGNVLCRPVLREYEIPYLGVSGAPAERQIPITDLLISIDGGRVVLRSRRLQREVIPRMTNAHNFTMRSQGIYRFLCWLQMQGTCGSLVWSWGPLESLSFLPRVVSGRVVLSPARWRLERHELAELGRAQGAARYRWVRSWRQERRVPRFVEVADGDNHLPVDLDNVMSVESFVELIRKRSEATIVEMFPDPERLCASGPEGRFVHEMIVPFVRSRTEPARRPAPSRREGSASIERSFPPGSEWLFVKIYAGTSTVDQLLREVAGPIAGRALESGAADRWFFLRYSDPDWHLRLRLHGPPERMLSEVLPSLRDALSEFVADGRVWRVQVDTYQREVERYGGPAGMLISENLFHVDSEAVVGILSRLSGDEGADLRWRIALKGMDAMFESLGFDLPAKRALVMEARDDLAREHRLGKSFFVQTGSLYRRERRDLEALLAGPPEAGPPLLAALEPLQARSRRFAPLAEALRNLDGEGKDAVPAGLARSYAHMWVNRILRSAQRQQELVLYDFLARLYESRAARMKKGDVARIAGRAPRPDPEPEPARV